MFRSLVLGYYQAGVSSIFFLLMKGRRPVNPCLLTRRRRGVDARNNSIKMQGYDARNNSIKMQYYDARNRNFFCYCYDARNNIQRRNKRGKGHLMWCMYVEAEKLQAAKLKKINGIAE